MAITYNSLRSLLENDLDFELSYLLVFDEKIRRSNRSKQRLVLRMSIADLQSLYLKRSGLNELIDLIVSTDKDIIGNIGPVEIDILKDNYTFKELITPKDSSHDAAVLLDVPRALIQKMKSVLNNSPKEKSLTATTPETENQIQDLKNLLNSIIGHENYVMSINVRKAFKILPDVEKYWNDIDDLAEYLNPAIVMSYPNLEELKHVKDEWGNIKLQNKKTPIETGENPENPENTDSDEKVVKNNPRENNVSDNEIDNLPQKTTLDVSNMTPKAKLSAGLISKLADLNLDQYDLKSFDVKDEKVRKTISDLYRRIYPRSAK